MNRREIIVVVAIVNIALLSLLFVTAQRVDAPLAQSVTVVPQAHDTVQVTPSTAAVATTSSAQPNVISDIAVDEVDSVLRDFAAAVAASHHKQPAHVSSPATTASSASSPVQSSHHAKEDSSSSSVYSEVIVKRGDFLERIARQQGSTIEAIKQANHLTSDHLKVGQVLRIPTVNKVDKTDAISTIATVVVDKPSTLVAASEEYQMYRVRSGDSPWKIAKQFQVDVEDLLRLNNLDEDTARNLKPGDTIRVH